MKCAEARLRALVADHRPAVLAHAVRLTGGDVGWAEDVTQETFLRAWRHLERMTPEYGSVHAWLLRVAHNLVVDGYRTPRVRHDDIGLDGVDDPAEPEATDQVLTSQVVHDALRRLPEPHRLALEATYLGDQSTTQAALTLNVPVGTVKSRVHYGLRMLRRILDVDGAVVSPV